MNINSAVISNLQQFVPRFQMWWAALSLRTEYHDSSIQEYNLVDADEFLDEY